MWAEENKAIVRREVEELYNPDGDLDAVDEIFAPDYILHDPSLPEEGRGPESARQLYRPHLWRQDRGRVAEL